MKSVIILIFIIVVLFFLFPKESGYSQIVGQKFKSCRCLGFDLKKNTADSIYYFCFGIPYDCRESEGYMK